MRPLFLCLVALALASCDLVRDPSSDLRFEALINEEWWGGAGSGSVGLSGYGRRLGLGGRGRTASEVLVGIGIHLDPWASTTGTYPLGEGPPASASLSEYRSLGYEPVVRYRPVAGRPAEVRITRYEDRRGRECVLEGTFEMTFVRDMPEQPWQRLPDTVRVTEGRFRQLILPYDPRDSC